MILESTVEEIKICKCRDKVFNVIISANYVSQLFNWFWTSGFFKCQWANAASAHLFHRDTVTMITVEKWLLEHQQILTESTDMMSNPVFSYAKVSECHSGRYSKMSGHQTTKTAGLRLSQSQTLNQKKFQKKIESLKWTWMFLCVLELSLLLRDLLNELLWHLLIR